VRSLLLLLAVLLVGGCQIGLADRGLDPKDGSNAGGDFQCAVPSDCVMASVKCCDCPTFAVPARDPAQQACAGVVCPPMSCADNVAPACEMGTCTLACKPLACETTCAGGYAIDASGCLTCECAAAPLGECTSDTECARVPADCCGCARGGEDTSVPQSEAGPYESGLGCGPSPSCPDVNTCAPGLAPACVQGGCALVPALPANACGRPDLPACASCVVNADDAASTHGVGVCM
jgi:hypothetical protein